MMSRGPGGNTGSGNDAMDSTMTNASHTTDNSSSNSNNNNHNNNTSMRNSIGRPASSGGFGHRSDLSSKHVSRQRDPTDADEAYTLKRHRMRVAKKLETPVEKEDPMILGQDAGRGIGDGGIVGNYKNSLVPNNTQASQHLSNTAATTTCSRSSGNISSSLPPSSSSSSSSLQSSSLPSSSSSSSAQHFQTLYDYHLLRPLITTLSSTLAYFSPTLFPVAYSYLQSYCHFYVIQKKSRAEFELFLSYVKVDLDAARHERRIGEFVDVFQRFEEQHGRQGQQQGNHGQGNQKDVLQYVWEKCIASTKPMAFDFFAPTPNNSNSNYNPEIVNMINRFGVEQGIQQMQQELQNLETKSMPFAEVSKVYDLLSSVYNNIG